MQQQEFKGEVPTIPPRLPPEEIAKLSPETLLKYLFMIKADIACLQTCLFDNRHNGKEFALSMVCIPDNPLANDLIALFRPHVKDNADAVFEFLVNEKQNRLLAHNIALHQTQETHQLFLNLLVELSKVNPDKSIGLLATPSSAGTIGHILARQYSHHQITQKQLLALFQALAVKNPDKIIAVLTLKNHNNALIGDYLSRVPDIHQQLLILLAELIKANPNNAVNLLTTHQMDNIAQYGNAQTILKYIKLLDSLNQQNLKNDFATACKPYFVADRLVEFAQKLTFHEKANMLQQATTAGTVLSAIFKQESKEQHAYNESILSQFFSEAPEDNLTKLRFSLRGDRPLLPALANMGSSSAAQVSVSLQQAASQSAAPQPTAEHKETHPAASSSSHSTAAATAPAPAQNVSLPSLLRSVNVDEDYFADTEQSPPRPTH